MITKYYLHHNISMMLSPSYHTWLWTDIRNSYTSQVSGCISSDCIWSHRCDMTTPRREDRSLPSKLFLSISVLKSFSFGWSSTDFFGECVRGSTERPLIRLNMVFHKNISLLRKGHWLLEYPDGKLSKMGPIFQITVYFLIGSIFSLTFLDNVRKFTHQQIKIYMCNHGWLR